MHMFRFGLEEVSTEDTGNGEDNLENDDHGKAPADGKIDAPSTPHVDESNIGMADPTSVSELRFRDIGSLKSDSVRGVTLPGVSRTVVKKHLKYHFEEVETGSFRVLGSFKDTTIIETFKLELSQLTSLMELQTMLYTPRGSKTTFVLPNLVKVIGEMQMRTVLL